MAKLRLSDFYFYRWRYYIGYSLSALLLIVFLLFIGFNVPGGLSDREMQSVVTSTSLGVGQPETLAIPNAPYYIVQKISLEIFGVTNVSIKLPSLIFSFIASIGAVLLLRRWFRPSVALLATLLMITAVDFLFLAQNGTPEIMYIMWSVWLLYAATQVTNKDAKYPKFWKFLFFAIAGLSLYSPLSLYLLVAIVGAALIHPHVRFIIRQISPASFLTYGILFLTLMAPLAYLTSLRPELVLELLGKPASWPPDIMANIATLFHRYIDFINPSSGELLTPAFEPGRLILLGIGVWQLARTHHNARSYTIAAWLLLLSPILIISPEYSSITFVPFLIVMASGIYFIIRSWYDLFPRNPYARATGLLPLVVLVGVLVLSSVDRYIYGYRYDPDTSSHFSQDTKELNRYLDKIKEPIALVVAPEKLNYYTIVAENAAEKNKTSIVVTDNPKKYQDQTATVIVSKNAMEAFEKKIPLTILNTSASHNADRFYIYKNTSK